MSDIIFTKYSPPPPPKGMVDITIGCFFDGTQNNRVNSRAGGITDLKNRTTTEANASKKHKSKENSYTNDWSNIARLEKWYNGDASQYNAKFYIEGIATTDLGPDEDGKTDHLSLAYGAGGKFGIPEKVKKGISYLISTILIFNHKSKINRIIIDTFGFSRGAAAARSFVSEIIKNTFQNLLKQNGISYNHFDIRFVGLFDTVSSYDPHASQTELNPNFENDVNELNLNAISVAKRIFHLTAADEFRENFSLTPVRRVKGVEFSLPGAHADIGGSYANNSIEKDMQILDFDNNSPFGMSEDDYITIIDEFAEYLIDMGWYNNDQLKRNYWLELVANRSNISNKYSYIPLHMMTERIIEVAGNKSINLIRIDSEFVINFTSKNTGLNLCDVKARLDQYIKGNSQALVYYTTTQLEQLKAKKTQKQMESILKDQKMLKDLKREFLHFSSYNGIAGIGRNPRMVINENLRTVRFQRLIINNA